MDIETQTVQTSQSGFIELGYDDRYGFT